MVVFGKDMKIAKQPNYQLLMSIIGREKFRNVNMIFQNAHSLKESGNIVMVIGECKLKKKTRDVRLTCLIDELLK